MSDQGERAARARRAFDEGFARAPAPPVGETVDLLAASLGGDLFALPVAELSEVQAELPILPLHGAPPGMLGLAGVRGRLLAVYDLAVVLGYAPQARAPRWLLIPRADLQIALALHEVSGYLRVPVAERVAAARSESEAPVSGLLVEAGRSRSILSLPAIVAAILRRAGGGGG